MNEKQSAYSPEDDRSLKLKQSGFELEILTQPAQSSKLCLHEVYQVPLSHSLPVA